MSIVPLPEGNSLTPEQEAYLVSIYGPNSYPLAVQKSMGFTGDQAEVDAFAQQNPQAVAQYQTPDVPYSFPDGTPSGAAAAQTPASTLTARDADYPPVQLLVRPERHRAQSCAIALRSPASERSPDLNRYSPDIHHK